MRATLTQTPPSNADRINFRCGALMTEKPSPRSVSHLFQAAQRGGLRSAAVLVAKNLSRPFHQWLIRRRMREHEAFDSKYGIDTQTRVHVSDLETSAPGARFANRYEGTPTAPLRKIIRRLKVDRRRFTFIDLGSGKGRVLVIAAQYPFKAIIGIEFSKRLHDIALANLEQYAKQQPNLRSWATSINCDAGDYNFSNIGNKIIFCYNPFGEELMIRIIDKLTSSCVLDEETILIYLGPMPSAVSDKLDHFPIILRGEFLSEFGFYEQYSGYQLSRSPGLKQGQLHET